MSTKTLDSSFNIADHSVFTISICNIEIGAKSFRGQCINNQSPKKNLANKITYVAVRGLYSDCDDVDNSIYRTLQSNELNSLWPSDAIWRSIDLSQHWFR